MLIRQTLRLITMAVLITIAGCQTMETTRGGEVGVDRRQQASFLTPSAAEVDAAARQQYAQIIAEARKAGTLNRDRKQVERVRAITERLIPHTKVFREDAPGWQWEVNVLTSEQINAWCMPGGKMAVYTGIIEKLELTDAELAAIMGHEIAHALREHARERMGRQQAAGIGLAVVEILGGVRLGDLGGTFANAMFVLPNGRENEQEGDRIGVELAARAGYDPRAAVTLWEKMMQQGGNQPPQWLSTHPSHQARISDLKAYSERVMPLYRQVTAD
jgi:predicted Zn-dependent protease